MAGSETLACFTLILFFEKKRYCGSIRVVMIHFWSQQVFLGFGAALLCSLLPADAAENHSTNDYPAVAAIFGQHCLDCHASQEPEGKLVMETFATLMKGGESGPALVAGKSAESLLVKMIEGRIEKDGKKRIMPPGKRKKLDVAEIAVIKSWIDEGAAAPKEEWKGIRELVVPKVLPTVPPRRSIQAIAFATGPKLLAIARYGEVELMSSESRGIVRTLKGHRGKVNAVVFSRDGKQLAAAAGEPALFGEVRLWNVADGTLIRTFEGHADALYSLAISPDGKLLATGSYDQKIKLWDIASGQERQTLSAHNGAIFDLGFRPDGKILASASGDRTVKLWNVATGKRVETLSQSLKELHTLAWSPDGQRVAAAGVDNRIRIWQVSENAVETTNPLLIAKFAHEGAILNVLFSPDGKTLLSSAEDLTVKLWDAAEVTEKKAFEMQPDVTPALTFLADAKSFAVGRLDGTVDFYNSENGKRLPPAAPEINAVDPRGIQRGTTAFVRLKGKHLANVTNVVLSDPKLTVELSSERSEGELVFTLKAAPDLAVGPHEISVVGPGGSSAKLKLSVDDLPQIVETNSAEVTVLSLPASFWGTIEKPGDTDEVFFEAKAGQTIVLDLAVKSVGSKLANGSITVLDEHGAVLDSDGGFDGNDRLAAVNIATNGRYVARVADQMLGASTDHFYRLSIGALPFVTGIFPLSVNTNSEVDVELIGFNLRPGAAVRLKTESAGEKTVPIDTTGFRTRKAWKVVVGDGPQMMEREPNNGFDQAALIPAPGTVNGRISFKGDADVFRFEAQAGEQWYVETEAARRGSPVDTRIQILRLDGTPVTRMLLQAVRNTAINFRGVDSNGTGMRLDNYEEMELNEYLYLNGDVMRLFRMPQGPDSDMMMYTAAGKRRAYFDTTAVAHSLDEQGFIVQQQPLGANLSANGLPVFTLNYENDDEAERKLGSDSRVLFTAPTNGGYLVRVTDTRGYGSDTAAYRLILRRAAPDFKVALGGANPIVSPGSGQSFTVTVERIDGFDGEIRVEVSDLPTGFSVSTPLVIEAGHTEAKGVLFATPEAGKPGATNSMSSKVVATAMVNGRLVTKEVNNLGTIKLGEKPKLYVGLEAYTETGTNHYDPTLPSRVLELTIAPGETIPAWLKVKRESHNDLVTFFAENLPHGIIVADIGLSGVLIPKGESERQIFFNAARWVAEQDRLFYMVEQQAGRQTSRPVLLKVRKPESKQASTSR